MNAFPVITRATWDGCRVPSPDERRARWAAKYFLGGYHRDEPDNDAPPFNDAPDSEEVPIRYEDIRGT